VLAAAKEDDSETGDRHLGIVDSDREFCRIDRLLHAARIRCGPRNWRRQRIPHNAASLAGPFDCSAGRWILAAASGEAMFGPRQMAWQRAALGSGGCGRGDDSLSAADRGVHRRSALRDQLDEKETSNRRHDSSSSCLAVGRLPVGSLVGPGGSRAFARAFQHKL